MGKVVYLAFSIAPRRLTDVWARKPDVLKRIKKMSNAESQISRVRRSKAEAKANYDRMSKWYEALAGSSEKHFIDLGLEKLSAQLGERILEIGFGTGYALEKLAQDVGASGKVHGIDISQGMLERTLERLRKKGLYGRVDLTRDDAEQLPYQDQFFDGIFISFTLELFDTPEIPNVIRECRRVLREGGRLCVVSMAKKDKENVMTRLYDWAHEKFPTLVDCRPIYVREAIESAGFHVNVRTDAAMWGLPVEIVLSIKT
jgi:ubiquinone/menaquinone biosynthesis C-methylase UbiE